MRRRVWRALGLPLLILAGSSISLAQALNWEQVHERFLANNPNVLASRIFVREAEANEITAGLRPNPQLGIVLDQFHIFNPNPLQPFNNAQWTPTVSQLFERRHKRELRVDSAKLATSATSSDELDLERQLTFALRTAFVQTLQAKSILELAGDNLNYYDEVIRVNGERLKAGDISQSDFDRIQLQRVQFETDLINAQVSLRTAKITLLAIMNDRSTSVDALDITGEFNFKETMLLQQELRQAALDARPDLRTATTAVRKANVDNRLAWANGSWDPTVGFEYQRTQPDNTAGVTLALPIRIFDKNQGEKARTQLEIQRVEKIRDAIVGSIFRDVDSAYETVESTRRLLRPYRDRYLPQAEKVRETVSFAYKNGGASLLDFLDAQKTYRDTQLAYRNLIGSYLNAVSQLNFAVGREVIQ
jgi:cobalt-zinc-cadmium efflux system outer membrane protein